jgi:hypothetical protein
MPLLLTEKAGWRCDTDIVTSRGSTLPCARWEQHGQYTSKITGQQYDHMTHNEVMQEFIAVLAYYEGYKHDLFQCASDKRFSLWAVRASMIYKSKVYIHGKDD